MRCSHDKFALVALLMQEAILDKIAPWLRGSAWVALLRLRLAYKGWGTLLGF